MALNIKHKILLIITLNLMFLVVVGTIAYITIEGINAAKDNLVMNSELNKRLLIGLNARDNLRAIIYQGMVLDQSNPEEKKEISDQFKMHAEVFHDNIESLDSLNTNSEFDSVITEVITLSRLYHITAKELIEKELAADIDAFIMIGTFVERYNALLPLMTRLTNGIDASYDALARRGNEKANSSLWSISIVSVMSMLTSITVSLLIANSISRRILRAKNMIADVGLGKIPEKDTSDTRDEIGEMLSMLNQYLDSMEGTSQFAVEIGRGNFDTKYKPLSSDDRLGISLVEMCANLKRLSQEDKRRNWTTSGLAKFNEILRDDFDDLEKLSEKIIASVIQYLNFNQGCFYVAEEEDGVQFLSLKATYAWSRKKFVEHRVEQGQGLLGQVWLEGEAVYITDVPPGYVKITSGLGDATPRTILIMPLKINGIIYGILEMAAVQKVEFYEREFLTKVSENIAATLSANRNALQTKILLKQAQEQAKVLKEKEEVNLQNMEELQATQEEIVRKEKEYLARIERMAATIDEQHKQIDKLEENLKEVVDVRSMEKMLMNHSTIFKSTQIENRVSENDD